MSGKKSVKLLITHLEYDGKKERETGGRKKNLKKRPTNERSPQKHPASIQFLASHYLVNAFSGLDSAEEKNFRRERRAGFRTEGKVEGEEPQDNGDQPAITYTPVEQIRRSLGVAWGTKLLGRSGEGGGECKGRRTASGSRGFAIRRLSGGRIQISP